MKLIDGREIIGTEIDINNRLLYIVEDNLCPEGQALVYAEEVQVIKELPQTEGISTVIKSR